jgi:hypothetical protein
MTPDQIEQVFRTDLERQRAKLVEQVIRGVDDFENYKRKVGQIAGLDLALTVFVGAKDKLMGNTKQSDLPETPKDFY